MIIVTIIEALVITLVIVGLFCEPAIAKWEKKQKEKVLQAFKERKALRK